MSPASPRRGDVQGAGDAARLRVLITGCSSGFGLLTATELARRGHAVVATVRALRRSQALQEVAGSGLDIEVIELDVRDKASVDQGVAKALARGPLDVLVNNAGLQVRTPLELADEEDFALQFDTNVMGTIRMVRAVLPAMRRRQSGTIVNVSSVVGMTGSPYEGLYAASKHAVEAISESLSFEVAPFGIRVIVIEPGGFPTEFARNSVWGKRYSASSAYADGITRFDEALHRLEGDATEDPADVARCIADALVDVGDAAKFRYRVGNAAHLIARLRNPVDFVQFKADLERILGWPG